MLAVLVAFFSSIFSSILMTHNYRDYISIRNYLKYLMANHIIAMYTLLIPVSTQILSNILRSKLLRCPELLSSCAQSPSGSSAVQTFGQVAKVGQR